MCVCVCVCVYVCVCVCVCVSICKEKLKNKVIQNEEFDMKEGQCYNILVLRNHHQNLEKMLLKCC